MAQIEARFWWEDWTTLELFIQFKSKSLIKKPALSGLVYFNLMLLTKKVRKFIRQVNSRISK